VPGEQIRDSDLPETIGSGPAVADWETALREWSRARIQQGPGPIMDEATRRLESCLIDEALKATAGRRKDAAALLGIGRNTLTRKVGTEGDPTGDGGP